MLPSISGGMSKPASESEVGAKSMPLTSSSLTTPASMCPGPAHNAGYANAAVVQELFVADMRASVVGNEEDDGAVGYAFVFETLEHLADFAVEDLNAFEIHGPVFSDEGMIGIIRRDLYCVGIDGVLRVGREVAMGVGDVVLGVKGLALGALGPVDAVKDTVALEVEVGFAGFVKGRSRAVAGVISRIAEVVGDEANVFGQWGVAFAAVVMRAKAGLIAASDDGRSAWGTYRAGDKRICK